MAPSSSRKPPGGRAQRAASESEAAVKQEESPRPEQQEASPESGPQPRGNTNMLKGLAETATEVVTRAASILEEEVAAGVAAAKNLEGRFVDVKSTRASKPEEVLPRFRRDAHDVVDILMDLVNVATRTVSGITQGVIRVSGEPGPGNGSPAPKASQVPTLSPAQAGHAGATAELSMALENDGDSPTEEFAFHATDLVNPSGDRIAAAQISFAPESLIIAPHDRAQIAIRIAVPEGVSAGVYTGVLQATRLNQLRAMILMPIE